jgi:multidrug efflux system outer membrane protein
VLDALRQTGTALETSARDRDRAITLANAQQRGALGCAAGRLFRFGGGDFLSLLDAQRSLADAKVASAAASSQLADDQIAIFLALGGRWNVAGAYILRREWLSPTWQQMERVD